MRFGQYVDYIFLDNRYNKRYNVNMIDYFCFQEADMTDSSYYQEDMESFAMIAALEN